MASAIAEETIPEARVLVVDDEDNIVELLSVSLKFQGFEVHTATNDPQRWIWPATSSRMR